MGTGSDLQLSKRIFRGAMGLESDPLTCTCKCECMKDHVLKNRMKELLRYRVFIFGCPLES
jgi:hypothetical protein